jgi:hypothetical protein
MDEVLVSGGLKMRSTIKRLFTALLAGVFLFTSGLAYSGNTIVTYAAVPSSAKMLENILPIGVVLNADSFPGFLFSFNQADIFEFKEGKNDIWLNITMLDKQSAAKSAPALRLIFGDITLPDKVGQTVSVNANVTGISKIKYEEMILKTGNKNLYKLAQALTVQDASRAKEILTGFLTSLTEVINWMEVTEKLEQTAENIPHYNPDPSIAPAPEPAPAPSPTPEPTPTQFYDRTILIYLDGTDLESDGMAGTKNTLDLLRANIPSNVKIFVVAGGTRTWHMNDAEYYKEYSRRLLYPDTEMKDLTPDQKATVENNAADLLGKYGVNISGLQLWEVVNNDGVNQLVNRQTYNGRYITDTAFFSEMIDYCATAVESDKLDLIIWDHGEGFRGYGSDDLLDDYKQAHPTEEGLPDSAFSLKQIRESFAGSDFYKNGGTFDFIGFDACEMGNYEVVSILSPFADYYIGSEEDEPGAGWDYFALMNALGSNPDISTEDLGKEIVSSFLAQFNDGMSTLSLVDMKKVGDLDDAISEFAIALLTEIDESDSAYYELLSIAGKRSHFGTRTGFNNSNYLDIKRFATAIINNDNLSDDLKAACTQVIAALGNCVIETKGNDKTVDNGGLSVYFPLSVYYERPDPERADYTYFNNLASDTIGIYNSVGLNEDYEFVTARFALISLAGKLLGYDWKDQHIDSLEGLIDAIKNDPNNGGEWSVIYDAARVDEADPDDPILEQFEKLLADRIVANCVITEVPEDHNIEATVAVTDINPIVAGDVVNVCVGIFPDPDDDNKYISLGDTPLYSGQKQIDGNDVYYSVSAFDNLWYTLNNQICSMYVTSNNGDGSYSGYIPVCYWIDSRNASKIDQGDLSRTEYLKQAARENKVNTFYLNVTARNVEGTAQFTVNGYSEVNNGDVGINNADTSFLRYGYYELLGGADDLYSITETPTIESIGTFYYDEPGVDIRYYYVQDLGFDYHLADAYGAEYYLNENNLGPNKGLNNYYLPIPEVEATTWEQSQAEAERVRGWADDLARDEAAQANNANAGTALAESAPRSSADEPENDSVPVIVVESAAETSEPEVAENTAPATEVTENADSVTEVTDNTTAAGDDVETPAAEEAASEETAAVVESVSGEPAPTVTEAASEESDDEDATPETVTEQSNDSTDSDSSNPDDTSSPAEDSIPSEPVSSEDLGLDEAA